jgi:chemotaxis protein CheY-P-specific phosphatase CheC
MTGPQRDGRLEGDRLHELAGLGASWAAAAVEQLAGRTVMTSLPERSDPEMLCRTREWSTGLCFETGSEFPAGVGLFITSATRQHVVSMLVGGMEEVTPEAVASALREFGNIVASQAISAIANATGARVLTSLPALLMYDAAQRFALPLADKPGTELIACELSDSDGDLRALLVFVHAGA